MCHNNVSLSYHEHKNQIKNGRLQMTDICNGLLLYKNIIKQRWTQMTHLVPHVKDTMKYDNFSKRFR